MYNIRRGYRDIWNETAQWAAVIHLIPLKNGKILSESFSVINLPIAVWVYCPGSVLF